jgi:hypothetical protein
MPEELDVALDLPKFIGHAGARLARSVGHAKQRQIAGPAHWIDFRPVVPAFRNDGETRTMRFQSALLAPDEIARRRKEMRVGESRAEKICNERRRFGDRNILRFIAGRVAPGHRDAGTFQKFHEPAVNIAQSFAANARSAQRQFDKGAILQCVAKLFDELIRRPIPLLARGCTSRRVALASGHVLL